MNSADTKPTNNFIHSLPKAELHLHLEGSVTAETLVDLRKRHGKASTLAQAESLYQYRDFNGFLMAFKTLTEDLQFNIASYQKRLPLRDPGVSVR